VIRAGNAGGVLVAFNEGQATVLGQPGAIGEKIFPPDARFATLPDSTTSSESDTPNSP
jgi:hypothetical protein